MLSRWIIKIIGTAALSVGLFLGPTIDSAYAAPKKTIAQKKKRAAKTSKVITEVELPARPASTPFLKTIAKPAVAIPALSKVAAIIAEAGGESSAISTPKPDSLETTQVQSSATLAINSGRELGQSLISFDWQKADPAIAVFKTHGKWIIAFNQVIPPESIKHDLPKQPGLETFKFIPCSGGIAFELKTQPYLKCAVEKQGGKWVVRFQNEPPTLKTPVKVLIPQTTSSPFEIFYPYVGTPVVIKDEELGEEFVAMGTPEAGIGFARSHHFPQFSLLTSPAGIAVHKIADGLSVEPSKRQSWMITHPTGIMVTLPNVRTAIRSPAVPKMLFAMDKPEGYKKRIELLNEAMIKQPHELHAREELELAWIHLNQGLAPEALSYLSHLASFRPTIAYTPQYRLLEGISQLLMHHTSRADSILKDFEDYPDVEYLRRIAIILGEAGKTKVAKVQLAKIRPFKTILTTYPKALQERLLPMILISAIGEEDWETLRTFLDKSRKSDIPELAEVYDLAHAKLLVAEDKFSAAEGILTALAERGLNPQIKAMAQFELTTYGIQKKAMADDKAIEKLEHIRFRWRGDIFEYRVSMLLIDLLIKTKHYPRAIELCKQITKYFPDLARRDNLDKKMKDSFEAFFENKAKINPIEAVAVFENFQELMPSGKEGDALILGMAQRLADLDLLDSAVMVLNKQIDADTQTGFDGEKHTPLVLRVAGLHLLRKQPDEALNALAKITTCPPQHLEKKQLVQAEALFMKGHLDEALAALPSTPMGMQRKADMLFVSEKWSDAAQVYHETLGTIDGSPDEEDKGRVVLNLAISYNLSGKSEDLQKLKEEQSTFMAKTPQKVSFEFVTDDPSFHTNDNAFRQLADVDKTADYIKKVLK